MRTNIDIDDKLMSATIKATGLRTKKETVELALQTLLRLKSRKTSNPIEANLTGQATWMI